MTPEQIGQNIGVVIAIVGIAALLIWAIWALWKYTPFKHFVQFAYDVRRFIIQIVLMYSDEKSIFAKKRVESGVAFIIGESGMVYFLCKYVNNITDFGIWATIQFGISGYMVNLIQKEKKLNKIVDNADGVANKDKDDEK